MAGRVVLKVQRTDVAVTSKALVESGFDDLRNKRLTFHAYSDLMKARVLEHIAAGVPYVVKITAEAPRDGEWMEYPSP